MNAAMTIRRALAGSAAALLVGVTDAQIVPPAFLPVNPQVEANSPGSTTFNTNAAKTKLDVNSSSRRVVIRWDSFNIGAGNEVVFTLPDGQSIAVNRVACVANCLASNINGSLRSNGNVWILNPAGVLFGVGARVDVGGLLATPASIDDLRGFVNAATDAPIAFSMPANPGPVVVSGGAQILVRGGPAVLVGRNVTVSGTVKAADDSSEAEKASSQVLYGAAGKFRLLLKESAPSAIASGDLDLFDFIIDEGFALGSGTGAPTSIDVNSGSVTRAGQVLVHAKAAGTAGAGCAGCISIESSLEATAADRSGPLAAAMSLRGEGVDLLLQRTARFNSSGTATLDPLLSLNSRGSMNLSARGIIAPQLLSLRSAPSAPAVALADHVTVELAAVGPISLNAEESILMTSVKLGGARLNAKGDVLLAAAIADPAAGAITAGGSILLTETLDASGRPRVPGANLTVGDLRAGGDIFVDYRRAFTAGNLNATGIAEITVDEAVRVANVAASNVAIRSTKAAIDAGQISSGSAVALTAGGGSITFAGATARSIIANSARNIAVTGAINSVGNVSFTASGSFANTATIRVTEGTAINGASAAAGYGGVDIRASDVDIGGLISVRGSGAGIHLQASGAGGIAIGGGLAAPASGTLQVSDAELQLLDAALVTLRTGSSASSGGDITLGDFTLDRTRIGELLLATGTSGKVRVSGAVRGSGAPALTIGETGRKPGDIEVTGSLGALAAPLGRLQLRSTGSILIGSNTFLEQVRAATDLATFDINSLSPTLGGTTAGQLFIVSGPASFEAARAVLQQNTGGRAGDGIRIGAAGGAVPSTLIVSGSSVPLRVALFGTVVDAGGNALQGSAAASAALMLPAGAETNTAWRFNTCIAGSGASCLPKNDPIATIVAVVPTATTVPPPPVVPASPAPAPAPASSTPAPASSTSSPASSGSDSSSGGEPEQAAEREPTPEEEAAEEASAEVATASTQSTENSIEPIEIDPASRDLLDPAALRDEREIGVGAANEDLWPEGPD